MKQLMILVLAVMTVSLSAQNADKYEKIAAKQTAQWTEVCELTNEQSSAMLVVITAKVKEIGEAKELHASDEEALKAAKKEIHKKYGPQIKEIVGQENMKKMQAYLKQQREAKKQK